MKDKAEFSQDCIILSAAKSYACVSSTFIFVQYLLDYCIHYSYGLVRNIPIYSAVILSKYCINKLG